MSDQDKRRIKLDVRKNLESPDSKFMMVLLGPEAKKIRDLVEKVKLVCPRILDSDEVEVYQDKYLLPHDEEIALINTREDVIIIPIYNSNNNDVVVKKEYLRCLLCRKTFSSENKLLDHQKIWHKYKCDQCSRSYILNPDLLYLYCSTAEP